MDVSGTVDTQLGGKTFVLCGPGTGETVLVLRGVDLGDLPHGTLVTITVPDPVIDLGEVRFAGFDTPVSDIIPEPVTAPEPAVPAEKPKARGKKASS